MGEGRGLHWSNCVGVRRGNIAPSNKCTRALAGDLRIIRVIRDIRAVRAIRAIRVISGH